MVSTTAPFEYSAIIEEIEKTSKAWQSAELLSGKEVDFSQSLVLLCGLARSYAGHDDFPCLNYEIQEAAKAFLAKDFPACERHVAQARAWKDTMDEAIAEARRCPWKHKTPVR